MPKHRPETPISQDSSFSCAPPPQPSETPFNPGHQHPATPPKENPPAPKPTEPLRTPPLCVSAFFASINSRLSCSRTSHLPAYYCSWAGRWYKTNTFATNTTRRSAPLLSVYMVICAPSSPLKSDRDCTWQLGSRNVVLRDGSVHQLDAAFFYERPAAHGRWERDPFPRVVFKVAFKQRYEEVVEVARAWLTKSESRVEVVVMVNIEEGAISTGGTEEEEDKDKDEDKEEEEHFSWPYFTEKIRKTRDISQWVGSLTATMEFFRLSGNEMARDGQKYSILPPASEPDPVLRIADVVRGTAADDRTLPLLPLEEYRKELYMAARELAFARKTAVRRGRKRARGEEAGINGEKLVVVGEGRRRRKMGGT